MTALITPFSARGGSASGGKNGKIDEKTLVNLVHGQIQAGTDGLVPAGTTGESPTLSFKEHERVIQIVIDAANGKVPIVAGTGSNSTDEAIQLTRFAKKAGADGALLVTPYYNRPSQEGLFRHYQKIAKSVDIPLVLYNVPGRTGVSLSPETVARLSKISTIVAIKEATGSMDQTSQILSLCDIVVLSGDDSLTLPLLALGAKGVISVASNVIPGPVAEMVDAFFKGNLKEAQRLHHKMFPLFRALFLETNPVPVKRAAKLLGLSGDEVRLPLCPMQESNEKILRQALKDFGLKLKG